MKTGYHRKKQPAVVRRQLLDVAAQVSSEKGLDHLTLDTVAREAGVSKGGLLHHFPSKQALLHGLCDEMLERLDAQIAEIMEKDPEPVGRFSRAYLEAISNYEAGEDAKRAGVLYVAIFADAGLRERWRDWLENKLQKNAKTDSASSAWIVRLAADGLWLSDLIGGPESLRHHRQELVTKLLEISHCK